MAKMMLIKARADKLSVQLIGPFAMLFSLNPTVSKE